MSGLASYPCEAVASGMTTLHGPRIPPTGLPTTARDTHRNGSRNTALVPSSGAGLRLQRSHRLQRSNLLTHSDGLGFRPRLSVQASADPFVSVSSSSGYEPSQGLFSLLQKGLTSLPRPDPSLLPDGGPSLNELGSRISSTVSGISSSISGRIGANPGVSEAVSAVQGAATSAWGSVSGTAASLAEQAAAASSATATAVASTSGAFAASVSSVTSAASAAGSAAQTATTSPAAVAKLLSSESSVLHDFQDLVRLASQDSVAAVKGTVSSLASAVSTSPSFVRLESAGAKTLQVSREGGFPSLTCSCQRNLPGAVFRLTLGQYW